ncbi:hypothetical protein [Bailinhaonella thermotolerans]|uniref:hypothetical protein n=1 Tax=Bailinhaonella thermotolerans TaxID=1070861 RepID=UPI00192A2608|nr:hypothetical protein [Bailinhaonella thermotolerans]
MTGIVHGYVTQIGHSERLAPSHQPHVRNTVSGVVHGQVIQAGDITHDLNL